MSAAQIATAQAIPPRFLELILLQVKKSGIIDSRRGSNGGYVLAVSPETLTVGDVLRSADGTLAPVLCLHERTGESCSLAGRCAFRGVWTRVQQAVEQIYDTTTLQDLLDDERSTPSGESPLEYTV